MFLLYSVSVSASLTSLPVLSVFQSVFRPVFQSVLRSVFQSVFQSVFRSVFQSVLQSVFRTPRSYFACFLTELSPKTGIYTLNQDTSVTFPWFSDRALPEISFVRPKSGHLGHISLVFRPSCIGDSVTEKGEISEARVIREDFLESVGDLMSRHDILLLA